MKIIRHPKTLQPLNNPVFLPNREGFRFVGVRNDGTEANCVVEKKEDGTHYVSGMPYASMLGWRK